MNRIKQMGRIVQNTWNDLPNHIHGIIQLNVGAGSHAHPPMNYSENKLNNITNGQAQGPIPTLKSISLPNVIERFKSLTTKQYIDGIRNYSWAFPPY